MGDELGTKYRRYFYMERTIFKWDVSTILSLFTAAVVSFSISTNETAGKEINTPPQTKTMDFWTKPFFIYIYIIGLFLIQYMIFGGSSDDSPLFSG